MAPHVMMSMAIQFPSSRSMQPMAAAMDQGSEGIWRTICPSFPFLLTSLLLFLGWLMMTSNTNYRRGSHAMVQPFDSVLFLFPSLCSVLSGKP